MKCRECGLEVQCPPLDICGACYAAECLDGGMTEAEFKAHLQGLGGLSAEAFKQIWESPVSTIELIETQRRADMRDARRN